MMSNKYIKLYLFLHDLFDCATVRFYTNMLQFEQMDMKRTCHILARIEEYLPDKWRINKSYLLDNTHEDIRDAVEDYISFVFGTPLSMFEYTRTLHGLPAKKIEESPVNAICAAYPFHEILTGNIPQDPILYKISERYRSFYPDSVTIAATLLYALMLQEESTGSIHFNYERVFYCLCPVYWTNLVKDKEFLESLKKPAKESLSSLNSYFYSVEHKKLPDKLSVPRYHAAIFRYISNLADNVKLDHVPGLPRIRERRISPLIPKKFIH